MDIREFKEMVFEQAKAEGFIDYEIYYSKSDDISINVYQAEVDKYSVSTSIGLSFRGIYNGKMGYAYTENFDQEAVDTIVMGAKDNALSIESEDKEFIYGQQDEYTSVKAFNEELSAVSAESKIKLALELEKQTRSKSDKVVNIGYCGVASGEVEYGIMNSKGLDLNHKSNYIYGAVVPVVSDGKRAYDSLGYKISDSISSISAEELAHKSVSEALSRIGAASVKSGMYKAVLRNDVAATLLATFSGSFSADNVQKGLSLLKNKIGKKIATDLINIIDNPLLEGGLASSPFDAEGVATYKKNVVENGSLTTLLYNLKTAEKDGIKTTGNASKASYSSPVTIAPSNFYIEKGTNSFEDLLALTDEGLLITDLAGTHSGANPVTGDFSLAAKGYLIKEGKITSPVEQITVAGNYFELLGKVQAVGKDLEFTMPQGSGYFGSPSLMIEEVSIAGL